MKVAGVCFLVFALVFSLAVVLVVKWQVKKKLIAFAILQVLCALVIITCAIIFNLSVWSLI